MDKFEKLVTLLDELAQKYNFTEEDIVAIQEVLYDAGEEGEAEGSNSMYGDEFVDDTEETDISEEE